MGLSAEGLYENLKIIDVVVYTEKLYDGAELIGIDAKFIYKYMLGDKLIGEEEIATDDIEEAKDYIVEILLKGIDELGMYA